MNRKQIIDAITEAKHEAQHGDGNTSNMARNQLEVLNVLLWRWDRTQFYDEESDFNMTCDNIVEELMELEEDRIRS